MCLERSVTYVVESTFRAILIALEASKTLNRNELPGDWLAVRRHSSRIARIIANSPGPGRSAASYWNCIPVSGLWPGSSGIQSTQYGFSEAKTTCDGSGCPDRKSTRLNSSHLGISYAVFCL